MSFLKIKDPSQRDKLVAEFLKTKNKLQNDFRAERIGEQSLYQDFGKIFKPVTEQQKKSSEDIVSTFMPLQTAIENIPTLPWGAEGQPEALPKPPPPIDIRTIAEQYLLGSYGRDGDKTFGLKNKDGQFYLGKSKVDIDVNDVNDLIIDVNDLIIDAKRYSATQGLLGFNCPEKSRINRRT